MALFTSSKVSREVAGQIGISTDLLDVLIWMPVPGVVDEDRHLRTVSTEEAMEFAEKHNLAFIEVGMMNLGSKRLKLGDGPSYPLAQRCLSAEIPRGTLLETVSNTSLSACPILWSRFHVLGRGHCDVWFHEMIHTVHNVRILPFSIATPKFTGRGLARYRGVFGPWHGFSRYRVTFSMKGLSQRDSRGSVISYGRCI